MMFDKMFDLNHDGKLSAFERATRHAVISDFIQSTEKSRKTSGGGYSYSRASGRSLLQEDDVEELEEAGLDVDELAFMGERERRQAIENVGLDPDDYSF